MPNLGLNEALLVINKGNITWPIELFHQLEECFGCPFSALKPLDGEGDNYVLDTRYNVQLELRRANLSASLCQLKDLALNSQGQYRIDLGQSLDDGGRYECSIKILDYGECLLCPFAILICFLFALIAAEQAYNKFGCRKGSRAATKQTLSAQSYENGDHQARCSNDQQDVGEVLSPPQQPGETDAEQTAIPTTCKTRIEFEPPSPNQPLSVTTRQRIDCLDVFRGLTLAGMIFVNYGGAGYAIWDHKPWDGITLADFVFPFFIFSMGASIAISIKSLVKRQGKSFKATSMKILVRSIILFLLGIFLNSKAVNFEHSDGLTKLRLTGVLQRFAVSYLVIAFMYTIELTLNQWTRAQSLSNVPYLSKFLGIIFELLTAVNYTAIYVYVTFYFEYDTTNNCPVGYTGPGGQTVGGHYATCTGGSAAWLDRLVLGENHLYNDHEVKQIFKTQMSHDPEGILGYTTSIVLTLIGLQCGKILIGKQTTRQKLQSLGKWIFALAISCPLVFFIPINKRLWSLTFVLVTGLASFVIVLAFYILIDIYSYKKAFLIRLLSSAGKNSIFLYVAHSLIYGMLPWWFPLSDQASHMQLLFRLTWSTLVWLLIAHYMAYKKVFIKV